VTAALVLALVALFVGGLLWWATNPPPAQPLLVDTVYTGRFSVRSPPMQQMPRSNDE
jgi:hypothetical protein